MESSAEGQSQSQTGAGSSRAGIACLAGAAATAAASARKRQKKRRTPRRQSVTSVESPTISEAEISAALGEAERTRCYLDKLGDAELGKLMALRTMLPEIISRTKESSEAAAAMKQTLVWGVDLCQANDATDVILLKFLRAEDLDVQKAADRLVDTLVFRAERNVDCLAGKDYPEDYRGYDAVGGTDVEGRPVMISRYGTMDNEKVFGNVDGFVRYRMQVMEKAIAELKFELGAPEDLCQVHDYSGVSLLFKTDEVKRGIAAMTKVFSQHYPETKGKTIFVKFPTLFSKLFQAFASFIPERTRNKFLILGETDHAMLFENIAAEVVPEELGGMCRAVPQGQMTAPCQVVIIKARGDEEVSMASVAGPASLSWELRVCAGNVLCEVAFVPEAGGAEEVILSRTAEQPLLESEGIVAGTYQAKEAGSLKCRFTNKQAWFQQKVCVCRAQAAS